MDEARDIGKRLRIVRNLYNSGYKASVEQFAEELGEPKYNISNYENGKANIPPRLLISLYNKGFNPVYILTGNGSIYADNEQGKILGNTNRTSSRDIRIIDIKQSDSSMDTDELRKRASDYLVAAGDILRYIDSKK